MRKTLVLAIATFMAAAPVTTGAFAQTATTAMGAMTDDMVTVVNVEQTGTENDNSMNQIPAEIKSATPEAMKMAQDELMKDEALVTILKKKNVQLTNVVGVQDAASGGKTVYVK